MPSTSGAIVDAVVAVIEGLSLAGSPPVRKRKQPALHESDPTAVVFVAQGDGEQVEQLCTRAGKRRFLVTYPVGVAIAARNQGKLGTSETVRAWRETIRAALLDWMTGLRANGLPDVNNVEVAGKSVFDLDGLGKGLDWSEATFAVEVAENAG